MIEKKIRNLLHKTLGVSGYLNLVSSLYITAIRAGLLKSKYPELFYLNNIVKPGFVCVDIGANVGYYSVQLSKLTGKNGHVYAVEPVPLFAGVFLKNCKRFALNNITLYQVALGSEEKQVTLQTPVLDGVFRHGLTKVVEQAEEKTNQQSYTANMVVPDILFEPLQKIDFLKCDVEGYEVHLFPQLLKTLQRCKPTIQIEISSPENREIIYNLLQPLGYNWYGLKQEKLIPLTREEAVNYELGDFYLKV
jgi:FkbM family methyltransferase